MTPPLRVRPAVIAAILAIAVAHMASAASAQTNPAQAPETPAPAPTQASAGPVPPSSAAPAASPSVPAEVAPPPPTTTVLMPITPPPPAGHLVQVSRSHIAMQIPGAVVLALFYAFALLPAAFAWFGTAIPSDAYLTIPVAGPFIVACDTNVSDGDRGWLLFDGVLQVVGAAVLTAGTVWVSHRMYWRPDHASRWLVAPAIAQRQIGASVIVTAF